MSTWGTSPGKMATVTGLSESYISRLLTDKRNETFNKLRDDYKRKNLKNVVGPI
jgi:AraC-like DNA-binding protein